MRLLRIESRPRQIGWCHDQRSSETLRIHLRHCRAVSRASTLNWSPSGIRNQPSARMSARTRLYQHPQLLCTFSSKIQFWIIRRNRADSFELILKKEGRTASPSEKNGIYPFDVWLFSYKIHQDSMKKFNEASICIRVMAERP